MNSNSNGNGNGSQATSVTAEAIIRDLLGTEVPVTYEEEASLDSLDETPLQIRSDRNLAPKANVDAYAVQMDWSVFPPLVITQDSVLVDGHTRTAARRQRGETHDRALRIGLAWGGADEDTRRHIQLIGQVINNTQGQRLDAAETRSMVLNMLALDMAEDRIAAQAGVTRAVVRNLRRETVAAGGWPGSSWRS